MKNPTKKIYSIILGTAICLFLFSSCAEDSSVVDTVDSPSDMQTLSLAATPDELITIGGSFGDLSQARATDAAGNDRGRFNISLKYIVPVTERQEEVFEAAAARWERIIIGDVPAFTGTIPSAFNGFPPAVDGTLDDMLIEVALVPIDGPGSILGSAGPRFVRTNDFLTLTGVMFFDVDDLDFLEQLDLFEEVIVHEMGHVLGVGTLWNVAPFGFDRTLLEDPDGNPYFNGHHANVHWNAEGGDGELPIENIGGPGTRLGHWRESVLNNELMTGFLNLGVNPISRITAASMRDLGYGTATVGEQYELPKGAPGVDISSLSGDGTDPGLYIADKELVLQPIGVVIADE